jgi:hypothetical protein
MFLMCSRTERLSEEIDKEMAAPPTCRAASGVPILLSGSKGRASMAYLVRWTGADGDKAETVATAKAALTLYLDAIANEYTGVAVHDDFARTVTPDELARLADAEPEAD